MFSQGLQCILILSDYDCEMSIIAVIRLTDRRSYSVALRVNETSDLCEVAVSLADVLDAGGLHQHGIVRRQDSGDAFPIVFNQCRVLSAAHKSPHLLIGGDLRFLMEG